MLEPPAPCCGMPELLAPNPQIWWKRQLPPPPPRGGMPEPLASINGKIGFSQSANPCPPLSSQQPGLADTEWYYQPPEVLRRVIYQKEAPYLRTPLYSFCPLKGYLQRVTLVLMSAGTSSSLLWNGKTIGFQSTGLLEPPTACGGMSEPLSPKEMTSKESAGRFLTTVDPWPRLCSQLPGLADTVSSPGWFARATGFPIHRYVRTTSSLWWYVRATGSQRSDLYK
jgi:hypothetical protein